MNSIRQTIRQRLESSGWFLRRCAGLSAGVSLEGDWFLRCRLPTPRLVIDVGAHHGETVAHFVGAFPAAEILALEPINANFQVLQQNCGRWPNVTCFRLGLSDRVGDVSFILQTDSQTHSLELHNTASLTGHSAVETVPVTTLDAFATARAWKTVDLLKIDTEGHELAVLRGARKQFEERRIGAVLLETTLDPADTTHTQLALASDFLVPFGFHLTAIYDQVIWEPPARLAYFNTLFVSPHAWGRSR